MLKWKLQTVWLTKNTDKHISIKNDIKHSQNANIKLANLKSNNEESITNNIKTKYIAAIINILDWLSMVLE